MKKIDVIAAALVIIGALNWGLIACRESVPDLAAIAVALDPSLDELRTAAGLCPSTPHSVAPGKARPRRST